MVYSCHRNNVVLFLEWNFIIDPEQKQLLEQYASRKGKDFRSQFQLYVTWSKKMGHKWKEPVPEAYIYYLRTERNLSESSITVHLASIRRAQKAAETHKKRRATSHAENFTGTGQKVSRKEIDYLTDKQIKQLLTTIKLSSLKGLRDRVIIGVVLFTGMSEQEICDLKVEDIDRMDGKITVNVPDTLEAPRQVQVYESYFFKPGWFEAYLEAWLDLSGITEGYLFRGFYKGGNSLRPTKLHHNAVQVTLRETKVFNRIGQSQTFTALDLRRTFAKRLYRRGHRLEELQQILGHESIQTTLTHVESQSPQQKSGGWMVQKALPNGNILLKQLDQFMKNQK